MSVSVRSRRGVALEVAVEPIAVAGLVAVAALLRFWALGRQGLWYDEATTAALVRETPGQMLTDVLGSESTPPPYYAIEWLWVQVFGLTETGLRMLSAVAGVAAVPVIFLATRRLAGRRAALIAALLIAVNPLLIWYSQEARSYSLVVLEVSVCLLLLARAREQPTVGRLVAWAVAAAVAMGTHYFAGFAIAPQAIFLLADRRIPWRPRLAAMGPLVIVGIALLGLARMQNVRIYWFTDIPLPIRVGQIPQQFLLGFRPPATAVATLIAAAAVVAAVVLVVLRGSREERRTAAFVAAIGTAGVALPVLLAVAGADVLNTRNAIVALPPLAVAVAVGLGTRRAAFAGLAATAALVAVSLATVAGVQGDLAAQRGHFRQVAGALRSSVHDRAILLDGSRNWASSLTFYLPGMTWLSGGQGASVREIDVVRRLPAPHGCIAGAWWGAMCGYAALPPPKSPPARGFQLASSVDVAGFNVMRYRASRPVRVYQHGGLGDLGDRRSRVRGVAGRHVLITPA